MFQQETQLALKQEEHLNILDAATASWQIWIYEWKINKICFKNVNRVHK